MDKLTHRGTVGWGFVAVMLLIFIIAQDMSHPVIPIEKRCTIIGHFVSSKPYKHGTLDVLVTIRRDGVLVDLRVTRQQWQELGAPQPDDLLIVERLCQGE
jgi:hypothetical protein